VELKKANLHIFQKNNVPNHSQKPKTVPAITLGTYPAVKSGNVPEKVLPDK
jgi:hypothetical protein